MKKILEHEATLIAYGLTAIGATLMLKELKELRKESPTEIFRIVNCKEAGELTIQVEEEKGVWLCLHHNEEV